MIKTPISIVSADYLENYKIALKFNDEKEVVIDFEDFITCSQHPDIKKYKDLSEFKNFHLDFGELEWNDYELAFPIYDLYQGKITH